jgi:hypothetical protein
VIPSDLQDRQAWRGALVAAGLSAVGMPMDLLLARGVPGMPAWPSLASSAVSLLLIALLLARRERPTRRLASIAFLINNLAILACLWITSGTWATTTRWVPFQAHKLGMLAVAVLAPDAAVGLACIAGYAGTVLLKTLSFAPAIRSQFPISEPWTIFIYALFATVLLVHRMKGLALERKMLRLLSETAASERLARTFLAVRDFTNTPLQTIVLATAVLRQRQAELGPVLDRIDRAVDRLFRLHQAFSAYDAHLKWTDDDVSLDPASLIGQTAHHAPPP